jgi:hypothetical protein
MGRRAEARLWGVPAGGQYMQGMSQEPYGISRVDAAKYILGSAANALQGDALNLVVMFRSDLQMFWLYRNLFQLMWHLRPISRPTPRNMAPVRNLLRGFTVPRRWEGALRPFCFLLTW